LKDHKSKADPFGLSTPLIILDLNSLKEVEIANGNIRFPQWSPDGKKIFFRGDQLEFINNKPKKG
jgi:Tol biopolymer transport system component